MEERENNETIHFAQIWWLGDRASILHDIEYESSDMEVESEGSRLIRELRRDKSSGTRILYVAGMVLGFINYALIKFKPLGIK